MLLQQTPALQILTASQAPQTALAIQSAQLQQILCLSYLEYCKFLKTLNNFRIRRLTKFLFSLCYTDYLLCVPLVLSSTYINDINVVFVVKKLNTSMALWTLASVKAKEKARKDLKVPDLK